MVTKYPLGLFSRMMTVEDGGMSQIWIFITRFQNIYLNLVLHNKTLLGGIAACYETWIY